jgi:MFS-type transporter involved in bile tolerance (Atg22 family)
MALVSTMLGSGAITQSYLADSVSDEMQGTGLGVIRTTSATLGASGPVMFGVIADYGYLDEGYIGLAVVMVVVILLTLRMPRA